MIEAKELLEGLWAFHGHRCWGSTLGLRAGLAALRRLGAEPSGGKSLHAIVELGEHHGAMCFADGVQYATGCTFGKANIEKSHRGKLALTLIDTAEGRQVRVSYRPVLQPRIAGTAFMRKRAAGVPVDQIPEAERDEPVTLIRSAPEEEILSVGPAEPTGWRPVAEAVRFAVCGKCGELVAEPYLRVVGGEQMCLDCSGYQA